MSAPPSAPGPQCEMAMVTKRGYFISTPGHDGETVAMGAQPGQQLLSWGLGISRPSLQPVFSSRHWKLYAPGGRTSLDLRQGQVRAVPS